MPNLSHIDKKREPAEPRGQSTVSDSKVIAIAVALLLASAGTALALMVWG